MGGRACFGWVSRSTANQHFFKVRQMGKKLFTILLSKNLFIKRIFSFSLLYVLRLWNSWVRQM